MAVKTAQQAHTETTMIMARMFTAPRPWKVVAPVVAACLLSGLLVEFTLAGLLTYGILVFTFSALAGAVITKPLADLLGGRTYLRRTILLSLVTQGMIVGVLGVAAVLRALGVALSADRLVILALASTVWLRQVVLASTSQSHPVRNLPSILAQPLVGLALLWVTVPGSLGPGSLVLVALLFATFLLAAVLFTEVANRPLKRSFGVSGLRMMRHFLDHMTEQNGQGQEEIEAFFSSFSVPATVPVAALGFRSPSGWKAAVVAAGVHPGPFGTAGGSDLPAKIRRAMADMTPNVLVPHAPSTHDNNPASTADCLKIGRRARELLRSAPESAGAGPMVRANVGDATASAQRYGVAVLVTASLAPNPTDDIDAPTGFAATLAAREAGAKEVLFLDAHNSLAVGSGWVVFGTKQSQSVIQAAREAVSRALAAEGGALLIGYAERAFPDSVEDGLGAQGIQVLAVEAAGQRAAYVLFDGNNMVPGLREKIREALADRVRECEVLTTDNHSVNIALGGFNPVGARLDQDRLVREASALLDLALKDLGPASVAARTGEVEGIRVWGHESTTRLSTGINSTIAILRISAVLSLGLAFSVSLLGLVLSG